MGRTIHEIVDEYMREANSVKESMGLSIEPEIADIERYWKSGLVGRMKSSRSYTLQDLMNERTTGRYTYIGPLKPMGVQLPKVGYMPSPARWPSNAVLGTPPATRIVSYPSPVHEIVFTDEEFAAVSITMDEITFNDRPISDVISYDETTGEVHYYERHWSSGDLVADGTDPTGYRTQREKGNIKVVNKYVPPKKEEKPTDGPEAFGNPWYPYGIPGFADTVNNVSFEWHGRDEIFYYDTKGHAASDLGVLLNKLTIDGVAFGDEWTMTAAEERGSDLVICFVKLKHLRSSVLSDLCLAKAVDLGTFGLMGKAHEVVGLPHIYKTVRIQGANFSLYTQPGWSGDTCDPDQWLLGATVMAMGRPAPVDQTTAKLMKQLCS
jgi:hypothetical protein